MTASIAFDPLAPTLVVWIAALLGLAASLAAARIRAIAGGVRTLALGAVVLMLLNPILVEEDREPIADVAVVIVDESASMAIGERRASAEAALNRLQTLAARDPGLELRVERTRASDDGTRLNRSLERALAGVSPERYAGAVLITDGRAHDAPSDLERLAARGPVHTVLTDDPGRNDRRIELVNAPTFGLVGQTARFQVRLVDEPDRVARLTTFVDGEPVDSRLAFSGSVVTVPVPVDHAGALVAEFAVDEGEDELTLANNRVAAGFTGVRDRLRVLLISGEPHAGERTWRDLLKADPSVDLVHFTILRPTDKFDATPKEELALIEFPYKSLFEEKLEDFDLVIFDRYRRRRVIQPYHLNLVARYVENGGAVLLAAGPQFASPTQSLSRTSLAAVLPARPTGRIIEGGFRPQLTETGSRHPLTAALTGANDPSDPDSRASWGRWFRVVEATQLSGEVLMRTEDGEPLLLTDRIGEGRVAQFLSDHVWLWARGFEGGGPQAEMLRRLAHWLMSEPELEEEAVRLRPTETGLRIERRTLAETAPTVTLTGPGGESRKIALEEETPGVWAASLDDLDQGLWRARSGEFGAVAAVGPIDPREARDVSATDEVLRPLVRASGGRMIVKAAPQDADDLRIRRASPNGVRSGGADTLTLVDNGAYRVTRTDERPALPYWLALVLIGGLFALSWRLESR